MPIAVAEMLVTALGLYALAGVVVGLAVAAGGAARFDPDFAGAPAQARLLIFWGAAGLWPLMLVKLLAGRRAP